MKVNLPALAKVITVTDFCWTKHYCEEFISMEPNTTGYSVVLQL